MLQIQFCLNILLTLFLVLSSFMAINSIINSKHERKIIETYNNKPINSN